MNKPPKVTVVGSLNTDITYRVDVIPVAGQTIASKGARETFGGKGANQALAALRAGSVVDLIGCTGMDSAGANYLEYLKNQGMRVSGVRRESSCGTGSAVILTENSGENLIVVEAGSNAHLTRHHIDACRAQIEGSQALLMQFETPMDAVIRAAEIARAAEVPIVLNPSPWDAGFSSLDLPVDFLIVNETEASAYFDCGPESFGGQTADHHTIITRGSAATLILEKEKPCREIETFPVTPVDTVGAGDAFAGYFTVSIANGKSIDEAVQIANVAGALATRKPGAQQAIPHISEVLEQAIP